VAPFGTIRDSSSPLAVMCRMLGRYSSETQKAPWCPRRGAAVARGSSAMPSVSTPKGSEGMGLHDEVKGLPSLGRLATPEASSLPIRIGLTRSMAIFRSFTEK
jgi:hypothetical protein